jgi:hypothetical protein
VYVADGISPRQFPCYEDKALLNLTFPRNSRDNFPEWEGNEDCDSPAAFSFWEETSARGNASRAVGRMDRMFHCFLSALSVLIKEAMLLWSLSQKRKMQIVAGPLRMPPAGLHLPL